MSNMLEDTLRFIENAQHRMRIEQANENINYLKLDYDKQMSKDGEKISNKLAKLQKVIDALYEAKSELEEYLEGHYK